MMDGRVDQDHLEFIMRHQGMGMVGFPVARSDSEEAPGSSESEPAAARPRGKRARAAEVHNLSEKRRRCKINEKMKALQSLVPNSSKVRLRHTPDISSIDSCPHFCYNCWKLLTKALLLLVGDEQTDKASMLDDAIEYLKHLQLQVQMLSMRNGLYRPPVNLPGRAPEPLPTLQMCTAAMNQNNAEASNPAADMLPMTQTFGAISGTPHSFGPLNQDRRHQEPLVLPSIPCTTTPEPRFLLGSSQPHLQSLQLTVSAETDFRAVTLTWSEGRIKVTPKSRLTADLGFLEDLPVGVLHSGRTGHETRKLK
ncbi:hypothetical protein ACQ4PT_032551 [Festuca glaucescens]